MLAESLPTLAVIRCGDSSRHLTWAGNERLFDIGVSYFGDDPTKEFPEAQFVHRQKGGKWDGLYSFFEEFPETLNAYDYFWFPDDDITANAKDINRLFDIGRNHKLHAFQPSLDTHSYYSHLVTLNHPSFNLRFTNFIEIMVPVIGIELLRDTLPLLKDNRSGFGMDFLWPTLAMKKSGTSESVAIIDSVSVCHTRPVGGSLHQLMRKVGGKSAVDEMVTTLGKAEMQRTSRINGVAVPRIRILSGLDRSGKYIVGVRLSIQIARDLIARYVNYVQPVNSLAALRHALKAVPRPSWRSEP
jgi:hypothetical protein